MSTTTPATRPPAVAAGPSTWRVSWRGVRTVAGLELRQRVRSTRWIVVLVVWFAVLLGLTLLLRSAVYGALEPGVLGGDQGPSSGQLHQVAAASVFGAVVFLVLALGGLVAPALTATSVNGDRTAGVLAALQTTLLTPAEIALGKLAAAWVTALALLAVASPFIIWSYFDGGTPLGRLLTTLVVLALTLLVVCAVALGWSAVTARTSSSTVLTYLTVVFLGLGLPLAFLLSLPLTGEREVVQVRQFAGIPAETEPPTDPSTGPAAPAPDSCTVVSAERVQFHTERNWWLLAANPFVVVADTAPPVRISGYGGSDPLTMIRDGVREARLGPGPVVDECYDYDSAFSAQEAQRQRQRDALPATWPFGLAADLALGAGFVVLAVRRLRAPARTLPRGTRVA